MEKQMILAEIIARTVRENGVPLERVQEEVTNHQEKPIDEIQHHLHNTFKRKDGD